MPNLGHKGEPDKESRGLRHFFAKYADQSFWSILTVPVVPAVSYALFSAFQSGENFFIFLENSYSYYYSYFISHPTRLIITLVTPFIISSILVLPFIYKIQVLNKKLAAQGMIRFSKHIAEKSQEDWDLLTNSIRKSKHLCISGATGYRTFSERNSKLFSVLNKFEGDLKILILNPSSIAVKTRAAAVKQPEKKYRDEIEKTIKFFDKMRHIKPWRVKLYSRRPIFKIIITDDLLWIQHYGKGNHVDSSPVFMYSKTDDYPIWQLFFDEFLLSWEESKDLIQTSS